MVYILITFAVFMLDSNIKNYIEQNIQLGEKKNIFKGKITVRREYNSGFCYNLLDDSIDFVKRASTIAFSILTLTYIFILPKKRNRLKKLGLSLCIGGAASNLRDRCKKGKVVDYFSINIKPLEHIVFNLADIFIFIGSLLIFFISIFNKDKDNKKTAEAE